MLPRFTDFHLLRISVKPWPARLGDIDVELRIDVQLEPYYVYTLDRGCTFALLNQLQAAIAGVAQRVDVDWEKEPGDV